MTENTSPPAVLSQSPLPEGDGPEGLNLHDVLDTLYDHRWLIAAVTAVVTLLGGIYALMASPVYESSMMVQVEDNAGSTGAILGEMGMIQPKASLAGEMELIRSRMVVSRAVDNLRLYIGVEPRHFPLIGGWLSRRAKGLSEPGLLSLPFMRGYVWGQEHLEVSQFNVPQPWLGRAFTLERGEGRAYTLIAPDGKRYAGTVGELQTFEAAQGTVDIQVPVYEAKPGAHFHATRYPTQGFVESLQGALKIAEKGRGSSMIGVSLEGGNPWWITNVLNEIGKEYVRQNVDRRAEEAANTLKFLDTQLPQLRQELDQAETTYNNFRNAKGTVNLSEEGSNLFKLGTELQTKLFEMRQKRDDLASRYTAAHPSVQLVERQLAELRGENERIAREIRRLPQLEQETLRLARDVKANNELYVNLLNSAQQLKLVKAGKVGNVRLIDPAVTPLGPFKPQRSRIVLGAALIGLALGAGLAWLRKMMHGGIKDPSDIERALGMTVYATVPHSDRQGQLSKQAQERKGDKVRVLLATDSHNDAAVESLRSLRTAMQFAMLDAPSNLVLISGPTPGLGKSFIAVNFAAVLAAGGKRVLVIDGDLRKGYLHLYFGIERGRGLSEVVAGTAEPTEVVHANIAQGLDFISTGQLPPNPSELLMHPHLRAFLQFASQHYDYVIIDSPPVLSVSDTAVLGAQVGATFLVARESSTSLGELEACTKRLNQSGVHVRGVIFNDVKPRMGRYGYGYGYRYGRYRYSRYSYAPYGQKAAQGPKT
ncbi:MAG: polysaccharide biosynthesis tyrosine autokinase [Limnohabitans sp.]